jgi:F-type H+-transporting ATPase subunit b
MKSFNMVIRPLFRWVTGIMILHFLGPEALAADNTHHWRSIYDLVLMWLNFGILVFILVKLGKNPLRKFLRERKEDLEREIKRVEEERDGAAKKVKETLQQLEESKIRLVEIKEKIVKQGEKKKQEIIQDAQQESRILLSEAKRKIDYQILKAKDEIQAELVDAAVTLSIERLPREITEKDNHKFIDQYIVGTQTE